MKFCMCGAPGFVEVLRKGLAGIWLCRNCFASNCHRFQGSHLRFNNRSLAEVEEGE